MKIKSIVIAVIALVILSAGFQYFIERSRPEFIKPLIKMVQEDKDVLQKIGKYKSFELNYNESISTDTLEYKLRVIGDRDDLDLIGYALKKDGEWENGKYWESDEN